MKIIATLTLLFCISTILFCQEEKEQVVSLHLLGIQHEPYYLPNNSYHQNFYSPTGFGFGIRKNTSKQFGARLMVIYRNNRIKNENEEYGMTHLEAYNEIQTKLGFQYQHSWNKIEFFGGIDALFMHGKFIEKSSVVQNQYWDGDGSFSDIRTRTNLGISPFLGLNYRFKPAWSIGFETNAYITQYWHNYDSSYEGIGFPMFDFHRIVLHRKHLELNPLSAITLNYHF